MALSPEQRERQQQRIEDCRELYLRHGGERHELIEREMRLMGHRDFHRRSLYRRFERGTCKAGWIDRFGWERLLRDAEKSSPPYEGGVADVSSDGVVLSSALDQSSVNANLENHPPANAVPLLRKEGSFLNSPNAGAVPPLDFSLTF